MPSQGKLFVFEGPDGVGKTTLAHALVNRLNASGDTCEYMAFPGREPGTLGHHIYALHHNPQDFDVRSINPTSLQVLHIASHIDAIERLILPTLSAGKSIVLDRFWWSTLVYGKVYKANFRALEAALQAEFIHWNGIRPTAAFLVTRGIPINDQMPTKEWQKLCAGYYELASEYGHNYPVYTIKNETTEADALKQVLDAIFEIKNSTGETLNTANHSRPRLKSSNGQKQLSLGLADSAGSSKTHVPTVLSRLSPAEPSEVFDTYWKFAVERQRIFFCRIENSPPPWTTDKILGHYRFTNAYRASDRVSQYLIRHVIYEGAQSPDELFFRIMLFKIFNRIETWNLLQQTFGMIRYGEYSFEAYDKVLNEAMRTGTTIFSAAYIMPSGVDAFGYSRKHRNYLRLLEKMIADNLPQQLQEARSMRQAFDLMRSYPLMGDFLAYQYIIDINYSPLTNFSEMEFVMPGPGAQNGIRKCFHSLGGLNEVDIIRLVADRQEEEFTRLGLEFRSLWGRSLQLIDCQNLFCEVDKYARVAHPDAKGISDRKRIKQVYRANYEPIAYWYPPKWGINDLIGEKSEAEYDPHLRGQERK